MTLQIRYVSSVMSVVLAIASLCSSLGASAAELVPNVNSSLRDRVGGGNIVTHLAGAPSRQIYAALHGVGARLGRMNSYGWRNLARVPTPHDFDAAMREAYEKRITPIILLEYEGSYQNLEPPQLIGSYDDWFVAGQVYAKRFRPDGEWAKENGISGWGVTIFTAINEPDVQATIPRQDYRDALAGLADGVHSIDASLRVVPGGFATCNSHGDATLRGYGPAIAGLFEDGRLDGLDLHTYYHDRWYPITRGREFSVQTCFDRIKQAMGLQRDINFYATEFNVARDGSWEDPKLAARLFLTAFWDQIGVVRADRRSSATVLAFPWSLPDTGRMEGIGYAMAASEDPWTPAPRAKVLRTILELAGDMRLKSLDLQAGLTVLESDQAQLIVWHNLPGWTVRLGSTLQISVPEWANRLQIWGWDGLRRQSAVKGGNQTVDGLAANETYMIRLLRSSR